MLKTTMDTNFPEATITTFYTPETFEVEVEQFRQKHNETYLDSIVTLFEKKDISLEDANEYISPLLKMKLENELLKTRQLKYTLHQSDFESIFG